MSFGKPVIKASAMDPEMQDYAVDCAISSLRKGQSDQVSQVTLRMLLTSSRTLLSKRQSQYGIVLWVSSFISGRHFAAYVTHEIGRYIYFYIGQKGFLLFSTVSLSCAAILITS